MKTKNVRTIFAHEVPKARRKRPNESYIKDLEAYIVGFINHHHEYHEDCYASSLIASDDDLIKIMREGETSGIN